MGLRLRPTASNKTETMEWELPNFWLNLNLNFWLNRTFLVRFGGRISGSFGLTMGIVARLHLAKIRTMARQDSSDMPPKRTKKIRLGLIIECFHDNFDLIHIWRVKYPGVKGFTWSQNFFVS